MTGGGFNGATSNGFKQLQFEKVYGSEDWHILGKLLTAKVRYFRGAIKKDLLPQPFVDPQHPNIPPAITRRVLNNSINCKRKSSNKDELEKKKLAVSHRKEQQPFSPSESNGDSLLLS